MHNHLTLGKYLRRIPLNSRYVRLGGLAAAVLVFICGGILLAGLATYYYLAPTLPEVGTLRDVRMQVPLRIYTRDGRLLAQSRQLGVLIAPTG